jgi:hypothetical protein
MFDRLILSAVLSVVGWNGLNPEPPTPPTTDMLIKKAKYKSISAVCMKKKKKSDSIKRLCKRWDVQDA